MCQDRGLGSVKGYGLRAAVSGGDKPSFSRRSHEPLLDCTHEFSSGGGMGHGKVERLAVVKVLGVMA